MKRNIKITGLAIAFLASSPELVDSRPHSLPKIGKSPASVEEVVDRLVGIMDTSAQAKVNSKVASVRMTTCRVEVTPSQKNAIFLYQEQALGAKLSEPYRQRFLRISSVGNGKLVESAGFKPPEPEIWIGLCDRPLEQRVILTRDLGKSECSVFLHKQGDNYIGETQPGGCPTKFRGAVKITNRVTLHPKGMDTWDRGYDERGNIIWGAKQEPYRYLWVKDSGGSR